MDSTRTLPQDTPKDTASILTRRQPPDVNSKHKDSLFRMIFRDKKELLGLYNALAGTDYRNPDDLTVTTLEDVLYISLKNDISFLLDGSLNLYEHQSTFNPNMPLRGLLYMAELYKPFTAMQRLYSSRLLKIPTPHYVVFYNGAKKMPEASGICYFIATIRKFQETEADLGTALRLAMNECIKNGILAEILTRKRMVIMSCILSEFDEEAYAKVIREDGFEEGYEAGFDNGFDNGFDSAQQKLLELTSNLLAQKRYADLERSTKDKNFLESLYQEFNLK